MTMATLTEDQTVEPVPNGSITQTKISIPPQEGGTERDILQLVMQDGLCVHVIVKALRGKDRPYIEQILKNLAGRFPTKGGTERDILQLVVEEEGLPELAPEILSALDHLLGSDSHCLHALMKRAVGLKGKPFDWRRLPVPFQP